MNKLFYLLLVLLMVSCDFNKKYDKYKTLKNSIWSLNAPLVFNATIQDTLTSHHVFLNIRANNDYTYRNLYIVSKMTFPTGVVLQDTLEYEMADAFGNWLGTGITNVKNNKFYYLENFKFPALGNYKFEFYQMMRQRGQTKGIQNLKGITDVGLRIETVAY